MKYNLGHLVTCYFVGAVLSKSNIELADDNNTPAAGHATVWRNCWQRQYLPKPKQMQQQLMNPINVHDTHVALRLKRSTGVDSSNCFYAEE
jgi:hypothetical protein